MTQQELKQAAIECLRKAFTGETDATVYSHVVQAAVSIVLAPLTPKQK